MSEHETPAEVWEARYADSDRVWSGRVNQAVADIAAEFTPGRALDLGCGEGGDAVWLAQRGWQVTGVDLSTTAVQRGRAAAAAAGISADRLELVAADLATWTSEAVFDLVTTSFLHSWEAEFPREEILRRASGFVAPGGHLLIVSHASTPPWASQETHEHHHDFPTPESEVAGLELDPDDWTVLVAETRERTATGPDGVIGAILDGVVLAKRNS